LIIATIPDHRPRNSGSFIGHRHGDDVMVPRRGNPRNPLAQPIRLCYGSAHDGSTSMHKQHAQIGVTALI